MAGQRCKPVAWSAAGAPGEEGEKSAEWGSGGVAGRGGVKGSAGGGRTLGAAGRTQRRLRARNYWTALRRVRAGARLRTTVKTARRTEGARTWARVWGAPQWFVGLVKCEGEPAPVPQSTRVARPSAGATAARAGRQAVWSNDKHIWPRVKKSSSPRIPATRI